MWIPRTQADIELAIAEGSLTENLHLDVKRESGDTNSSRGESAKDMASFALDGGSLLIGVAEDKAERTFDLCPQPLSGLPEKLEQIATNRIDPPLFIKVSEIPSDDDPSLGFAFVEIPPSPTAPHMVDGRYYARGDRTTRRLTDAEVVRYHTRRENISDRITALLDEEIKRDPYEPDDQRNGHFYIVVEPLQARGDLLLDVVRPANVSQMFALLNRGGVGLGQDVLEFAPTLGSLNYWPTRARGIAATSLPDGARSVSTADIEEKYALDIEIQEHGGIRVFCGRMTQEWRPSNTSPEMRSAICDALALGYVARAVRWAKAISGETGYRGSWGFGFAATGLNGLISHARMDSWGERSYPYDRHRFEATTTATITEIEEAPGRVVNRVIGQLLRGLGTDHRYAAYLT